MLDLAKGNLWLLLILQEVHEKEYKRSLGKEIHKLLRASLTLLLVTTLLTKTLSLTTLLS